MFAFLLSEKMDPFYEIITSFPTVIFSFLLIFCLLYSLVAVLGLIDFDFLDFDIPGGDLDPNEALSNVNVLAGLLMRMGLHSVPFPLTLSAVSLIGWFISYYVCFFSFPYIPDGFVQFIAGIAIFILTLYSTLYITGKLFKPLRPMFEAADQQEHKNIIGSVGIVRTMRVDKGFGEVSVDDGGAGLIVKARAYEKEFKRGDRVVLIEYIEDEHLYKIISEQEFNQ